jgi:hypothetical protein
LYAGKPQKADIFIYNDFDIDVVIHKVKCN